MVERIRTNAIFHIDILPSFLQLLQLRHDGVHAFICYLVVFFHADLCRSRWGAAAAFWLFGLGIVGFG